MQTIRKIHGHEFGFVGQLVYEGHCRTPDEWLASFDEIGVRLYEDLDSHQHFLCVENAETGDETWYHVDGSRLTPADDDASA